MPSAFFRMSDLFRFSQSFSLDIYLFCLDHFHTTCSRGQNKYCLQKSYVIFFCVVLDALIVNDCIVEFLQSFRNLVCNLVHTIWCTQFGVHNLVYTIWCTNNCTSCIITMSCLLFFVLFIAVYYSLNKLKLY